MSKEMISSTDFQQAFVRLFSAMRKYVWEFNVIEMLADLEVAIYDAFMNVPNAKQVFEKLQKEVKYKVTDDEDLDDALAEMAELFDAASTDSYYRLYQVQEAVKDENF